jgi:hypothetical protein
LKIRSVGLDTESRIWIERALLGKVSHSSVRARYN